MLLGVIFLTSTFSTVNSGTIFLIMLNAAFTTSFPLYRIILINFQNGTCTKFWLFTLPSLIRHIHKGLRYHIIIDAIKHEKDKIVIRYIATTNDIFKGENVFMTRESNTIEKKRGKGKKAGKESRKIK